MTHLLPPNATPVEIAMDESIGDALDVPVPIRPLWDAADCPVNLLPWLAWALSVDFWDDAWPEADKRAAIAASIAIHRKKGVAGAIRNALRAAGYGEVEITEGLDAKRYDGRVTYASTHFYSEFEHWAYFTVSMLSPVSIKRAGQIKTIIERVQREACELFALRYDRALNTYNAAISYDGAFTHGVVDGQSL